MECDQLRSLCALNMYQTNVTDTFLIDDLFVYLLEALRHHQEQTRPIEGTTLAIEKLQAMTAKTTAERVAAMRAARDAAGLKRLELYAHTGDWPAIKALAEKLQARRQRSDKREPANGLVTWRQQHEQD